MPGYGSSATHSSIFSNGGSGISPNGDGQTANDTVDAGIGPNNLQNYPALASTKNTRKGTTVGSKFNSTLDTTFTVQFFANPSGTDEGKTFLGEKSVTTDANGDAPISVRARKQASGVVSATTTDPGGNTSEFSLPRRWRGCGGKQHKLIKCSFGSGRRNFGPFLGS